MNIELKGYFDKNFGDDLMHLLAVRGLAEHEIYVPDAQREMTAHLWNEPNVHIGKAPARSVVLNVTGTGFQYGSRIAAVTETVYGITAKRDRRPMAVIGCSIERIHGRIEKTLINRAFKKYLYISCRDTESYEYLKKNVKCGAILYNPDMVFSMADGAKRRGGDCMGIAPVRKMHGDENFEYYKRLAAAADLYAERYGGKILLFAFDNGLENDFSACCSIRSMMAHGDMVEIVVYDSNPDWFIDRLSCCGRLVTSRFHGAVIGAALGIPLFAVYDKQKLLRLCRELGIKGEPRNSDGAALRAFVTEEQSPIILPGDIAERAKGHIEGVAQWLKYL